MPQNSPSGLLSFLDLLEYKENGNPNTGSLPSTVRVGAICIDYVTPGVWQNTGTFGAPSWTRLAGGGAGGSVTSLTIDGNGNLVLGQSSAGSVSVQTPSVTVRGTTTGTVPFQLSSNGQVGTQSTTLVVPTGLIVQAATGRITGQDQSSGDVVIFDIAFAIKRTGIGQTPTIVGNPSITQFAADTSMTGCSISVSVSSTNIQITAYGVGTKTIFWSGPLTLAYGS